MRKDILIWKIKNSRLYSWFLKVRRSGLSTIGLTIAIALFSISFCQNVSAYSATSFGIAQYNLNGTWTSPFSSSETNSTQIVSGSVASFNGLNGIRFVRYANWGDGRYFGGNANLAVTFRQPASATDYNYVVDTNTSGWSILCGNGSSFAAPQSLNITNFSISKNDWGDNGTYKYFTMNYSFNFSGTFSSAQSGGYDFYCSIQKNGGFGTIRYATTNIYYENTIVTMNAFASESEIQLGQLMGQNQTMINQNNTIISQNQEMINTQNQTNQLLEQQQQQEQQDRDNLEDSQKDGQDNADESKSLNQSSTATLFEVVQGVVGALQSDPTHCRINVNVGHGLDFHELDFCQGKPSQLEPLIDGACVLVMSFVGFLWGRHLLNRFVKLSAFAQGMGGD